MRIRLAILAFAAAALLRAPAARAEDAALARVASPDGRTTVELSLNGEGRLAWRAARDGKPLIGDSRLGFVLRNGRELLRNLALESQSTRASDSTWEQPWGEERRIRDRYNELRARFAETDRDHRRFDVVFRVYDDGLGFRYELPRQPALQRVEIEDEATEFDVARPSTAWWIPAGEWNRYEYLYRKTPLAEVSQVTATLRSQPA